MEEDSAFVAISANVTLPLRRKNDSRERKVHGEERRHPGPNSTAAYMAELDTEQLLKLQLFYLPDFELFGYPLDEIPMG